MFLATTICNKHRDMERPIDRFIFDFLIDFLTRNWVEAINESSFASVGSELSFYPDFFDIVKDIGRLFTLNVKSSQISTFIHADTVMSE